MLNIYLVRLHVYYSYYWQFGSYTLTSTKMRSWGLQNPIAETSSRVFGAELPLITSPDSGCKVGSFLTDMHYTLCILCQATRLVNPESHYAVWWLQSLLWDIWVHDLWSFCGHIQKTEPCILLSNFTSLAEVKTTWWVVSQEEAPFSLLSWVMRCQWLASLFRSSRCTVPVVSHLAVILSFSLASISCINLWF